MTLVALTYDIRYVEDAQFVNEVLIKGGSIHPDFVGIVVDDVLVYADYDGTPPMGFADDINDIAAVMMILNLSVSGTAFGPGVVNANQPEVAGMADPRWRLWRFSSGQGVSIPISLYLGRQQQGVQFEEGTAVIGGSNLDADIVLLPGVANLIEVYDAVFPFTNGFLEFVT